MIYLTATQAVDIYRFTLTLTLDGVMASGIEVAAHGMAAAASPQALARILAAETKATALLEAQIIVRGLTAAAPRGALELFWSANAPPTPDTGFIQYSEWWR